MSISPLGVVGSLKRLNQGPDEPRLVVATAGLGNLHYVWPHLAGRKNPIRLHGVGTGVLLEDTRQPAVGEAYERYSAAVFHESDFIWATADELGRDCLDLATLPQIGDIEEQHPRCPLVRPRKDQLIRWMRGVNLHTKRETYIPVVLVHLYAGFASRFEQISLPITTGCAAHIDYGRALLAGLLEVVERDALSVMWLQQLRFPRIDLDSLNINPGLRNAIEHSAAELDIFLWNLTADLGVPTIYGLQRARQNATVHTLVGCSSALCLTTAVEKVLRDLFASRVGNRILRKVPDRVEDFNQVFHGSLYMAHRDKWDGFNFMFSACEERAVSRDFAPILHSEMPAEVAIQAILQAIQDAGHAAYAVDISTDESRRAGLKVVRVLVPGLQPMPYTYLARYLGHPRLYEMPARLGVKPLPQSEINPYPNPFA